MKESTIVERTDKDRAVMSNGNGRVFAGPKFSPWAPDELWSDPVRGARPVQSLKTLNPSHTEWAGRYMVGAEMFVGLLTIDTSNGNGTNHESSIILPHNAQAPEEDADWLTCKAVDGRIVQPRPYPPADPTSVVYPAMWGAGDSAVDIMEYGGMSYGKFDLILHGPDAFKAYCFTVKIPDHLERGPLSAGQCIVRKDTGEVVFQFSDWCRCIDAAGAEHPRGAFAQLGMEADAGGFLWLTVWPPFTDDGGSFVSPSYTPEAAAWWADPARVWPITIDPTVTAGAQSGTIFSESAISWAVSRTGESLIAIPYSLQPVCGFEPDPVWSPGRAYLQFDGSGIPLLANASLFIKTATILSDAGDVILRRMSADYGTLSTADWGAAEAATEGTFTPAAADSWNEIPLDAAGIDTSGNTCYILREKSHDYDNADPNDNGGSATDYGATFYGPDTAGSEPYIEYDLANDSQGDPTGFFSRGLVYSR